MEIYSIIQRGRNCDSQTAQDFAAKNMETITHYKDMKFSAQYIYDVINEEN